MSSSSKFTRTGVRDYEKRRYRGFDQRIVHAREMRLIRKMLALAEAGCASRADRVGQPGRRGRWLALDLPCGYGRFTPMLQERGFDVVSADLSFEMARRAAENAAELTKASGGRTPRDKSGPGTWFPALAANADCLPFQAGVFDLVFSIRFFHHVHAPEDRAAILREFHRASSGYVVASFYRANGLHAVQRRLRRFFGKSRTNIKMVGAGVFEKAAEEAGFEVVRVLPLFRGLHAYHLVLLKRGQVFDLSPL
ncbi:MAG: class I SAM-dependent methyltransferase [Candidatus Aminicenantes bacterium]|nr:class I SAM-dependent methyltransferase [Candidatus Aminicenantes bacterium]